MSSDDDMAQQPEWDDVAAMWQAGGPDLDIAKLFRRARFNWWKIRLSVVTNMFAALAGGALCIYAGFQRPTFTVITFCLFGIVFCATSGRFTYQYYKGSAGDLTKDTKALLKLQIRQLKSVIAFARFNFWACFAVFMFGMLALNVLHERESALWAEDITTYYVIALTALTLIIYPLYYRNVISRKTRELDELTSSLGLLDEGDD